VIAARESSPALGLALAAVALAVAAGFVAIAYARDRLFGSAAILYGAIALLGTMIASSVGAAEIGLGLVYATLVAAGGALLEKTHYRALAVLLVTCAAGRWLVDLDAEAVGLRWLACAAVGVVAAAAASSYALGHRTRASVALGAIAFPSAIVPLSIAFAEWTATVVGAVLALELGLLALAILRRDERSKLAAWLAFGVSLALLTVLVHLVASGAALTVAHVAIGTTLFFVARRTAHSVLAALGLGFFGWAFLRIAAHAVAPGELAAIAAETAFVAAGIAISALATERAPTRVILLVATVGSIGAALYLAVAAFFEPAGSLLALFSRLPARDVTHSLVFAAFGGALLAIGLWQKSTPLRIASLAVVLGTLAKVFLFDVGRLDDLARVASLTALAVSLIAISFVYQRFVFRRVRDAA
jgi:hypothetical protein